MSKSNPKSATQNGYQLVDLEYRVAKFSGDVISLTKILPATQVKILVADQVIRSVTSTGANYFEFTECITKKDRASKLSLAKKECKETKYWLLILYGEFPKFREQVEKLGKESQELVKIFSAILNKIG